MSLQPRGTVNVDAVLESMDLEHRYRVIGHTPLPRRRLWLEVAAHADDLPSLVDALRGILESLERGCPGGVTGSASMGCHYRICEDQNVTPASYQESLRRYLDILRAETSE